MRPVGSAGFVTFGKSNLPAMIDAPVPSSLFGPIAGFPTLLHR